ncbi:hypothetical protein ABXL43_36205, partial [Burkholderia sola]
KVDQAVQDASSQPRGMRNLPPDVRAKLATMNPDERKAYLQKLRAERGGQRNGGNGGTDTGGGTGTGPTATPASDEEAARFLLQAQFSATDEEIAALRAKGYGPWLAEQFAQPVGTTGTAWLMQRGYGVAAADTRYDNVS